ncbi:MAG: hypothetical protein EA386_04235 [Rhodobacteraceae bacterium]|nr:MAG: hypothetical protein EA386_04235 [Paracoccaceae bacterium]
MTTRSPDQEGLGQQQILAFDQNDRGIGADTACIRHNAIRVAIKDRKAPGVTRRARFTQFGDETGQIECPGRALDRA